MIALWLAKIWTKAGTWLALAGAVVAAIFAAMLYGEHKGKQVGVADAAKQAIADARAAQASVTSASATRASVEAATAKLPEAQAQKIADADPATAAGELRQDGWTRN